MTYILQFYIQSQEANFLVNSSLIQVYLIQPNQLNVKNVNGSPSLITMNVRVHIVVLISLSPVISSICPTTNCAGCVIGLISGQCEEAKALVLDHLGQKLFVYVCVCGQPFWLRHHYFVKLFYILFK